MKTWPLCSPNPFFKSLLGAVLLAPSLGLAQPTPLTPLQTPASVKYPGVYESFEMLIQFDQQRFDAKSDSLLKFPSTLPENQNLEQLDLDPDFMNSLMLNSSSSYLHMASRDRCAFYDALIADLLKTKEGKIERVFVQFQSPQKQNITAIMAKQDFLNRVVLKSCPKSAELIAKFQVKSMDATIAATSFDIPTNREQCSFMHDSWNEDARSPYWCQVHELLAETAQPKNIPASDTRAKKQEDTRQAVAKILRQKLSDNQQSFLENFCTHADNKQLFCDNFFRSNFFSKIAEQARPDYYIKDICQEALAKQTWSPAVLRECVRKLRSEHEACFWGSHERSGLSPRPRCDHLSLALNYSSLWSESEDCPRYSDQPAVTNFSRVINHFDRPKLLPSNGFCSAASAGRVFAFNKQYMNEEVWKTSMCYFDRVEEKERCLPFFFGDYGASEANATLVTKEVLFRTKGASKESRCEIVKNSEWNPNLLKYRYGCFLVLNEENCGIGRCDFRIMFNEKEIKDIKVLQGLPLDYFPTDLMREKYSLTYLLQRDAQKNSRPIRTLPQLSAFFKEQPNGLMHGIGCAEDLLPSFFRKRTFNQCSPLPFVVDGLITEGDRVQLVTRSAADNIHAPRLVSWSSVYSAVRSYQHLHPVKQWTMHAVY